jgi:hypothetical protein
MDNLNKMEIGSPEWIEQQRAICDAATPGPWTIFGVHQCFIDAPKTGIGDYYSARSIVAEMWGGDPGSIFSKEQEHANATFIIAAKAGYRAALDALEASIQREAEKDATIARLTESNKDALKDVLYYKAYNDRLKNALSRPELDYLDEIDRLTEECRQAVVAETLNDELNDIVREVKAENVRLTAERDAEKKRADAAEHKIYEIAHSGLCSACEQDFEVCQGADDYDDCRDGCPFVNLFLCGEVTGAIEPDGPCAENAPSGAEMEC